MPHSVHWAAATRTRMTSHNRVTNTCQPRLGTSSYHWITSRNWARYPAGPCPGPARAAGGTAGSGEDLEKEPRAVLDLTSGASASAFPSGTCRSSGCLGTHRSRRSCYRRARGRCWGGALREYGTRWLSFSSSSTWHAGSGTTPKIRKKWKSI